MVFGQGGQVTQKGAKTGGREFITSLFRAGLLPRFRGRFGRGYRGCVLRSSSRGFSSDLAVSDPMGQVQFHPRPRFWACYRTQVHR